MREGWKKKSLGEVCTLQRGYDLPKRDRNKGEFPLISSSGEIDSHEASKVSNPGVVTGRSGSIGSVFFIEKNFWPLNTTLYVKNFHGNDERFIYYLLKSIDIQQFAGGAGVPTLNRNIVHTHLVGVPESVQEQKRIVVLLDEAFEEIDAAIANTEKNLTNALELFDSYLNAVFTNKGQGWVEKKLVQCVSSISTGPFGSMLHKSDYIDGGIPIVNPINIIGDRIKANESKTVSEETVKKLNTYILDVDDIVIGRRGEIGRCAVVQADQAGWLCGTGCFYIKPSKDLNPNFLVNLLRSSKYREELEKVATGATMKNLSNNSLKNIVVAYPKNPEEQYKFLALFDELSTTTKSIETIYQRKLDALNELKQSLLAKAFSGELSDQPEQILKEAVG